MANRYWVGGPSSNTASWTDTTHWSTTSGGSSGASAPASSDDVFFDANSNTNNTRVTFDAASGDCKDLNISVSHSSTTDLAFINGTFNIYGSLSNTSGVANFGLGGNSLGNFAMFFKATSTGKTITVQDVANSFQPDHGSINFSGIGGEWTMQHALNVGSGGSSPPTGLVLNSGANLILKSSTTNSMYNFMANGSAGNLIVLRSSTIGSQTTMAISNTSSASYVDVKDNNATGTGSPIDNTTGGVDSGDNNGWTFPANTQTGGAFLLNFV